jgi:hypothetical protein
MCCPGGRSAGGEGVEWFRSENSVRERLLAYPELSQNWNEVMTTTAMPTTSFMYGVNRFREDFFVFLFLF